MPGYVDSTSRRLRDVELVLPICVGTVAFYLGKKASDNNSHRWTVYVRGPNNEDLSYFVDKVVFKLHETFREPDRVVSQAPFEVTEHGWGEFDMVITIHFTPDARERPVELYHRLKLYNEDEPPNIKKPVVSELYEEFVFSEPNEDFYNRVQAHVQRPAVPSQLIPHFPKPLEDEELLRIQECRAKIASMCSSLRQQFDPSGQ